MNTTSSPSPSPRRRHGRLLVESLVALLLLNVTTLVVVSLARSATWSSQRARHTALAWSLATRHMETLRDSVCTPVAGSGTLSVAPVSAVWTDAASTGYRMRTVTVTSVPSPLNPHPLQLSAYAAWECP